MSSTTEKPITIGVEVEFMVFDPLGTPEEDIYYYDSQSSVEICKFLAKKNLPVACILDERLDEDPIRTIDEGDLVREIKISDNEFQTHHIDFLPDFRDEETMSDYRVWNITAGSTNTLPLSFTTWNFHSETSIANDLGYPALELRTPIISHPSQQKQLLGLVDMIRDNFNITINFECGMHIHAGYQSTPPCPSEDLYRARKVAAIVYLIEKPVFFQLCHPDRLRYSYYIKPISENSSLAVDIAKKLKNGVPTLQTYDENFGGKLIHSIRQFRSKMENRCVEEVSTFKFVERLFANGGMEYLEDKFQDLKKKLEDNNAQRNCLAVSLTKKTLEFRYFESMFDSDMMNFWIECVRNTHSIARLTDDQFVARYITLYEMATRKKEQVPGWKEWLGELGLSEYEKICTRYREWCERAPLDESPDTISAIEAIGTKREGAS